MRIEKINVLNGPNYWSVYRKQLIVLLLDLQEMEKYPTDQIDGFYERLAAILPSLYEHRCSEGREGGFFSRVKEGTWMGHVIEHIALEIQTLAGMDTGFGRTRSYGKAGTYQVVFSYILPRAGIYAATAATTIAEALIAGTHYDLEKDLQALRQIAAEDAFGQAPNRLLSKLPTAAFRLPASMTTPLCNWVTVQTSKGPRQRLPEPPAISRLKLPVIKKQRKSCWKPWECLFRRVEQPRQSRN
jgi:cyanophycin synthetase